MNKDDKQRVIGKIVTISSDKFTVELLAGIENFNINGFDDINYFAQLNSYIVIPYQNFYIIAEVAGVREKDSPAFVTNPKEQTLSKIFSGKFLDVLPIGSLKLKTGHSGEYEFEFGVSIYPPLYTDALYIHQRELDTIFNVANQEFIKCENDNQGDCAESCHCKNQIYKTLPIGTSSIFPDYKIKVDIDKFFGGHAAILGNTGSGKSCTIASIIQGLFTYKDYSATGSTFVFFDVNGEYKQAFSKISEIDNDLKTRFLSLKPDEDQNDEDDFYLPHWFLTIEEWALLLQATERTQLPILRNALGMAPVFSKKEDFEAIKNHILSTCISEILRSSQSPGAVSVRITAILLKFGTKDINLETAFSYRDDEGKLVKSFIHGTLGKKDLTIKNAIHVHFASMPGGEHLQKWLNSIDEQGKRLFIMDNFKMPVYQPYQKFKFEDLEQVVDLALLYEEAHGNNQIREFNSSMVTRLKSIKDRPDFEFLRQEKGSEESYKRKLLGLIKRRRQGVTLKKFQIINIDLSSLEDEIVEVVSCVITRILYEAVKEIEPRNTYPVNLVLEEAHRYIGGHVQTNFLRANGIFDRVAKEGRKFGLFLLISSQRPSELSKTVLSQCSNFIVHRIQNPEDLSHIRQITPHVSETVLRRMPSIPTQHALIFGHCVNLPATFKVNTADPRPKSDNNKISENWFKIANHEVNLK
jgi:hypothetical protein